MRAVMRKVCTESRFAFVSSRLSSRYKMYVQKLGVFSGSALFFLRFHNGCLAEDSFRSQRKDEV